MDKSTRDKKAIDWYSSLYNKFTDSLNGNSNLPNRELGNKSFDALKGSKFPTMKDEEWKYTNVNEVLEQEFVPATIADTKKLASDNIKDKVFTGFDYDQAVFYNGEYVEELSCFGELPKSVIAGSIKNVMQENPELVNKYFNKSYDNPSAFNHLNHVYTTDGFFLYVPDGKMLERPIQVVNISGSENESVLVSPHNLMVVGDNASASVILNHVALEGKPYFNNIITETFVGKSGNLNVYKVESEDSNSYHIERTESVTEEKGVFSHFVFTFGGKLVRNNLNSVMTGEFAEINYYGLYLGNKEQHIDNHTFVNHAKPNCESNELYKGILDDKARGVFSGKILVMQDAQKTNAYQSNKAVLLSEDAHVDAKPQLEIYADDVKCSHGATVGHLDDIAYFYIRSRGVPSDLAKSMLIRAFADDVVQKVNIEALREILNHKIFEHLQRVKI